MKNIGKIFGGDLRGLTRRFMTFVIAIVLCAAPCLFSLANIYANWDPYSNTQGMSIALCILDEGCVLDNGEYVCEGDELVEHLLQEPAVNWVVTKDEEKSIEGVKSGEYYGAIVLARDFSYNMYNMLTNWTAKPSITFYENGKKNTIGTMITGTAVSNVKRWLTQGFLEVFFGQLLRETNSTAATFREGRENEELTVFLDDTVKTLEVSIDLIDNLTKARDDTAEYIDPEMMDGLLEKVNEMMELTEDERYTTSSLCYDLGLVLRYADDALNCIYPSVAGLNSELRAFRRDYAEEYGALARVLMDSNVDLTALADAMEILKVGGLLLPSMGKTVEDAQNIIRDVADLSGIMGTAVAGYMDNNVITETLDDLQIMLEHGKKLTSYLIPSTEALAWQLDNTFRSLGNTLSLSKALGYQAGLLISAADMTMKDLDNLLVNVRPLVVTAADSLARLNQNIKDVKNSGYLDMLFTLMESDPEVYGEFFSELVKIDTVDAYTVDNFGSAMTPFYSCLAIWLGAVILMIVIKPYADIRSLQAPKLSQLFFGRYILYFIMSELQALCVTLTDLYILKVQCAEPKLFILSGVLAAFVVSLLIYALVFAFGNVGKTIVLLAMAVQVAGSSGTFPIQLLPNALQRIYVFFPLPHAINAMREAMFGIYGDNYVMCLARLALFIPVGLGIALILSRPFIRVNLFTDRELEETALFG